MSEIVLHSKQLEFIETADSPVLFLGGVRSGKTFAGAVKGCLNALRYFGSQGAAVAPTYTMVMDVLVPTYQKVLELWGVDYEFNRTLKDLTILHTGSVIRFRSAERPERIEGATLDWVHLDEAAQMKEEMFFKAKERIGIPPTMPEGQVFLTTTPKGHNWLYEQVVSGAMKRVVKVYTAENPLINLAVIEEARRTLPEKYFRQQYLADFVSWEGLVYDEFNPAVHIWRRSLPKFRRVLIGADIGYTNPTALLWVGETADGQFIIFDEYYQTHRTHAEVADYLKANWRGAECVVYDPSARAFAAEVQRRGLLYKTPQIKDVMEGIQRVKALFENRQLFITPNCENTLRELSLYAWQDGKETPVKQNDHAMDAMRYALVNLTTRSQVSNIRVAGVSARQITL